MTAVEYIEKAIDSLGQRDANLHLAESRLTEELAATQAKREALAADHASLVEAVAKLRAAG